MKKVEDLYIKSIGTNQDFIKTCASWSQMALNNQATSYLKYGFLRRCDTLRICIQKVFILCPQDADQVDKDIINETEIFLHSFIINLYGAIDNLAHILNFQLDLKFKRMNVGLTSSEKHKKFKQMLSFELQEIIKRLESNGWFKYLESYRHSLAHRIPLYIPPYFISSSNEELHEALEKAKSEHFEKLDFKKMDEVDSQITQNSKFKPIMIHDFFEDLNPIYFHPKIIEDWKNLLELSEVVNKEVRTSLGL